jgi:predicted Zn finger-like uncharacterized protein
MRIACPECESVFDVKSGALGDDGRKVKCASCSHVWFQKPITEEDDGEIKVQKEELTEPQPIPEGSNLPAETTTEDQDSSNDETQSLLKRIEDFVLHIHVGLKAATVALSFCCIFLYSITASHALIESFSFLKGYYHVLGIYRTDGIGLYDIKITKTSEDETAYKYNISGRIQNDTQDIRYLPDLRVSSFDKQGNSLDSMVFESDKQALLPEESIEFSNEINNISLITRKISLDIGDWIELAGR